jgi:uncharacterized membrane protein YdjX (TVP38/TMEM64 family)
VKVFAIIVTSLVVLFSVLFLFGESLGILKEQFFQENIAKIEASSFGKITVGLVVIVLLVADIILPIPSSIIMTLSGKFLGFLPGAIVASIGAMGAAWIGFYACRWGGKKIFLRLIGDKDVGKIRDWFDKYGVFAIILSRPVPMLTEILSCLAGLSQLSARVFTIASLCGTIPICFVYAWFGSISSGSNPWPAVWISLVIPAIGWFCVRIIERRRLRSISK